MPSRARPHRSASADRPNPVLCASAASRLLWAIGALLFLWASVYWAMD